jgi:hypothetical protein
MSFFEYLPHEYSYALYLAYEYDLHPYDSMILNMVSERYPRDDDEDSAADFDSAIDEDETLSHDAAMEVSVEVQSSTFCNNICFGSFESSELSTVQSASVTQIKPTIDGCTIQVGKIACLLVSSSRNIESAFAASKNERLPNLDSEIVVSDAIKGLNDRQYEFGVRAFSSPIKIERQHDDNVSFSRDQDQTSKNGEPRFAFLLCSSQSMISPHRSLCITVFDPGGTMAMIYNSVTLSILSIFVSISLFPFDPGGHH